MTNANLTNAALVAAAFNAEFNITTANGNDAVLVINDTDANSFSVWQYIESTGGAEIAAGEITLIGRFDANGAIFDRKPRSRLIDAIEIEKGAPRGVPFVLSLEEHGAQLRCYCSVNAAFLNFRAPSSCHKLKPTSSKNGGSFSPKASAISRRLSTRPRSGG